MRQNSASGRHIATGLGSPLSWLIYTGLALLIGWQLAPFWREALAAFLLTALVGIAWLRYCRACQHRRSREDMLLRLDGMEGAEFESWITLQLVAAGIPARDIRLSGDFGVDILADLTGIRIGIQAKRYAGRVGNDAVQQALAGCDYHGCSVAAVVTQSGFTPAALAQAATGRHPVVLVDRSRVLDLPATLRLAIAEPRTRRRIIEKRAQSFLAEDRARSL
jgi:hypothetical protein